MRPPRPFARSAALAVALLFPVGPTHAADAALEPLQQALAASRAGKVAAR